MTSPAITAVSTPKAWTMTPAASSPATSTLRVQHATPSSTSPTPSRSCSVIPTYSPRRLRRAPARRVSRRSWSWMDSLRSICSPSRSQAQRRSSMSIMFCMSSSGGVEVVADAPLQARELGGDVAFADAQDLGHLAGAALLQVEQQQGAVQRFEGVDQGEQHAHLLPGLVVVAGRIRGFLRHLVQRRQHALAAARAAQVRDAHVQGDPVHPGREPLPRVVAGPGAPELGCDLLRQVGALVAVAGVAGRDLEHDPAMLFKQRLEGAGIVPLHGHRCLHPHVRLAVCMVIRRAAGFVTTIRMEHFAATIGSRHGAILPGSCFLPVAQLLLHRREAPVQEADPRCLPLQAAPARDWLTPSELCLLGAIWGASFLFMRVAAPDFGPVPLVEMRLGLGALVLVPFLWRARAQFPAALWPKLALIGAINSAVPFILFAWAALHAPAGVSAITNAMTVLFTALVGHLFFGERIGGRRAMALMAGFAGVVVLASGKVAGMSVGWAVAAGATAALLYGVGINLVRRHLTGLPAAAVAC